MTTETLKKAMELQEAIDNLITHKEKVVHNLETADTLYLSDGDRRLVTLLDEFIPMSVNTMATCYVASVTAKITALQKELAAL